jgi:hypothetical protein
MGSHHGYPDDALVTGRVAAGIVGVHPNTLYRWIRRGVVPSRRSPGGALLLRVGDLAPDKLNRPATPAEPRAGVA